jgi:hypothetical protein
VVDASASCSCRPGIVSDCGQASFGCVMVMGGCVGGISGGGTLAVPLVGLGYTVNEISQGLALYTLRYPYVKLSCASSCHCRVHTWHYRVSRHCSSQCLLQLQVCSMGVLLGVLNIPLC